MVVGRETKGWTIIGKNEQFTSLDAYVDIALNKHRDYLAVNLPKSPDKGQSFFNLIRSVSKHCGSDGLVWANLFCASWNRNSPVKSPQFKTIQKYSELLLKKQIELFQPQTIIFANGTSSAQYRRAFFPTDGESRVCSGFGGYEADKVSRGQLLRFQLNGGIQCYRIQHPSSRSKEARAARHYLVNEVLAKQPEPILT